MININRLAEVDIVFFNFLTLKFSCGKFPPYYSISPTDSKLIFFSCLQYDISTEQT